ncbi:MAG: outer membrane lipoprotein carrier protein LolA [Candidatus Brocadiae bacterium]|nr:outer membrane lipoprotein carrier protein LolA [Candidatus Brocadiia bacterium]
MKMSNWPSTRRRRTALLVSLFLLTASLAPGVLGEEAPPAEDGQPDAPAEEASSRKEQLPPDVRMVLDKLDDSNKKIKDITAKVAYVREIPLLDAKQKSSGELIFKKPDGESSRHRIVLKLGKPRNEDVYTNGETWWVVSHNDKQVEIYKAAKAGEGDREAAFLSFAYGSSSEKLLKDYRVELVAKEERKEEETLYRLKFTPRLRKGRPARYEAIEVEVSDKTWLPGAIVLHEPGRQVVHTYRLRNIRTNTKVKDDAFEYKPPPGYTVHEL